MGNYIGKINQLSGVTEFNTELPKKVVYTPFESLVKVYKEGTQNEFEYRLNLYAVHYRLSFWDTLKEIVDKCGDKYNYLQIIEEHKKKIIYNTI